MFAFLRSGLAAPATQTFAFIESFFDTLTKKLRHLSTISMARRVISVTRSAVEFVER